MKNHSRLKISFCNESLIFSTLPLEIEVFQSWGRVGTGIAASSNRNDLKSRSANKIEAKIASKSVEKGSRSQP